MIEENIFELPGVRVVVEPVRIVSGTNVRSGPHTGKSRQNIAAV
jgi:hypothetical protein